MWKVLVSLTRGFVLAVAGLIGIVLILLLLGQIGLWVEADGKRQEVLEQQFPGREVSRIDDDEGPIRQFCYEIEISDKASGKRVRSYAMIAGDSDGGTWAFVRAFKSMSACIEAYNRG
jgi:hypothetical protein